MPSVLIEGRCMLSSGYSDAMALAAPSSVGKGRRANVWSLLLQTQVMAILQAGVILQKRGAGSGKSPVPLCHHRGVCSLLGVQSMLELLFHTLHSVNMDLGNDLGAIFQEEFNATKQSVRTSPPAAGLSRNGTAAPPRRRCEGWRRLLCSQGDG